MENSVPLLNPEQIEELNKMINSISLENNKCLDDLLSEQVEVANATMMQLYKLVVEEWSKKQKIIDNLCHFASTMMSTVECLWTQKGDNDERLSQAQVVIDNLNRELQYLGEENEMMKHKISETELDLDRISGEKQKIEELYHSQSCCNFAQETSFVNALPSESLMSEKNIEENSKLLEEKEKQILELKAAHQQLEQRMKDLEEENNLAKIEVELAEIAVSEAVSQRDASMISGNRSDLDSSYREEIYTTKSHGHFLNGELQCFSNLNDSFNKGTNLFNDLIPQEGFGEVLPLNQSYDSSLGMIKESAEDITASESPFKKKTSKVSQQVSDIFSMKQSVISQPELKSQPKTETNLLRSNKKTVSLQCNLVKDLLKLDFDYKKNIYEQEFQRKVKKVPESTPKKSEGNKGKKVTEKKNKQEKKKMALSKSEILTVPPKAEVSPVVEATLKPKPTEKKERNGNSSLGNLYNFFATKFVSQRIKVK